jgi:hypothetical protein
VLAGRVGANIAAELGTMRVTEQVDALETLAYDPKAYLVVPRVLAGLPFPIIVGLAMILGVVAAWAASVSRPRDRGFREGGTAVLPGVRRRARCGEGASFGPAVTPQRAGTA